MDILLAYARGVALTLLPIAAVFALLAIATKRAAIGAALRRCRGEAATNAGLVAVNYILLAPIMVAPVLAVRAVLPVAPGFEAFWRSLPEVAILAVAILLIELAAYWRHRIEHQPGIFGEDVRLRRYGGGEGLSERLGKLGARSGVLRRGGVQVLEERTGERLPERPLGGVVPLVGHLDGGADAATGLADARAAQAAEHRAQRKRQIVEALRGYRAERDAWDGLF